MCPSQSLPNVPPGITPNNGPASQAYEEAAYIMSDAAMGIAPTGNNATAQINLTMNMPLKAIKKTIFALDKDIVFPDIIVLRILFGPANKFAYFSTSALDPTAGAPAVLVPAAIYAPAPTTGTAAVRIYNLTLLLATEKNEDLAQSVRALVNSPSGLNILIDFPYSYKQNLSGSNQNISLRFNRGHGKNLLSIITSPFNNTESLNTAYDCFNVLAASSANTGNTANNIFPIGAKVLNYYTQLDNVRLQDITPTSGYQYGNDYRENRKFMIDTPYLNIGVYNNNYFHMDQFYERNILDVEPEENLDKGMSLIVERKYDLIANMNGSTAYNWYTFAIVAKDLHIGSAMIAYQ